MAILALGLGAAEVRQLMAVDEALGIGHFLDTADAQALPQLERAQVLKLLAYFSDPEDLIPDDVAVIGLLDDAIMLELLMRDIRHVVEAYDDFRGARETMGAARDEAGRIAKARDLARRRDQLHAHMRRRRVRESVSRAGNAGIDA